MTTEHRADVFDGVLDEYDRLNSKFPGHYYGLLDDRIVYGPTPEDVAQQLRELGYGRGEVLVVRFPGDGPFVRLCGHL